VSGDVGAIYKALGNFIKTFIDLIDKVLKDALNSLGKNPDSNKRINQV
jgi:hypothetical protein